MAPKSFVVVDCGSTFAGQDNTCFVNAFAYAMEVTFGSKLIDYTDSMKQFMLSVLEHDNTQVDVVKKLPVIDAVVNSLDVKLEYYHLKSPVDDGDTVVFDLDDQATFKFCSTYDGSKTIHIAYHGNGEMGHFMALLPIC
jgi:hypothetical protein